MSKISILFIVSIFFLSFSGVFAQGGESFDLVITNARIVDGTGNPWFRGSIAIKDGKIAKIGRFDAVVIGQAVGAGVTARQVIDAKGQIVAPGFIDVHTHAEDVYNNPKAENFIRMGVTSLVTGNCGGSELDIGDFLGRIKQKPLAVNLSTLIGHNTVRSNAMVWMTASQPPKSRPK